MVHMAIYNAQLWLPLYSPFHAQLGSGSSCEHVSTAVRRASGGWRHCHVSAPSLPAPALEFAKIFILPVLQELAPMA